MLQFVWFFFAPPGAEIPSRIRRDENEVNCPQRVEFTLVFANMKKAYRADQFLFF